MVIGTRKSLLALAQTELVVAALKKHLPGMEVELAEYETKGDRQIERSLADFGGKGAFTRDLEQAMLDGRIHMAVHSAKDMPLELPEGLDIVAVLKREDSRDVWVTCHQGRLEECPAGTIAGTGSRRRAIQAMELNPSLMIKDIRGNVPTRLRKLSDGQYDGIILAAAGLKRLGYISNSDENQGSFLMGGSCYYYEFLPEEQFLPAAGQGIIAVEAGQGESCWMLEAINDEETWLLFTAERAFLKGIGGGCNEAAAIASRIEDGKLHIKARYAEKYGRMRTVIEERTLPGSWYENRQIAADVGRQAAERLLGQEERI